MNARDEATRSLWMRVEVLPDAPTAKGALTADTVIVGSGIAGLSAAYELAAAGQKVIVVDRGSIAGGMTSRTTAHLAPICDDAISSLIDLRGEEMARLFQQSQEAAVDRIEAIVAELDIDCAFRRLDGFLFPAQDMKREEAKKQLDKEFEAAQKAGAAAEHAKGVPFVGFKTAPALRYPRQATFHPLKYLQTLTGAIMDKGGRLFANSPVVRIDASSQGVEVHAENGGRIAASHAIVATNSPINKRVELHSKMAPYRTYAMAFSIARDALPDALYWDMADPYHYVRLHPGSGKGDYLIAGGEDHKSGEADDGAERFGKLEAWIRKLVPELGKEAHRWSGQVMTTLDHCGYIGRDPHDERVFVATGDSGQGITHGALAGLLLKDLIVSGSSPWESVYDPSRKTRQGDRHLHQRERDGDQELRGVPAAQPDRLRRGAAARPGRHPHRWPEEAGGVPRPRRHAARPVGRVHASRMPRQLELDRAVLGLPVPRLAVRSRRRGAQRAGAVAARRGSTHRSRESAGTVNPLTRAS